MYLYTESDSQEGPGFLAANFNVNYIESGSQGGFPGNQETKVHPCGGVEDCKMESKCVMIVASEGGGNRDHVFILDTYMSKVPSEMVANNKRFYLHPMQHGAGYEGLHGISSKLLASTR